MTINPEGDVVLSENEKQTILEGMRLLSIYCENLTGCNACPFMCEKFIDTEGNKIRACECREYLPACWSIPDTWTKEGAIDD